MIRKGRKALLDGVISGLLMFLIGKYSISIFASTTSSFLNTIIILFSVLFSSISAIFNLKSENIRGLIGGYLVSCISSIAFLCGMFILNNLISISIIPQREVNSSDGLLILILGGVYLIGVICVRVTVFIIQFIRLVKTDR